MAFARSALIAVGFGAVGCYQRPDLLPDRPDEIPLVPEGACAQGREEIAACTLDGDTFDVGACGQDDGERIRMLGIDAPEIEHAPDPADCWGDEAAAELRRLLLGKTVILTFDEDCTDVYGRTLAYVWLPGEGEEGEAGLLVNEWMLLEGHARRFDEDWVAPLRLEQRFIDAEASAAARGLGLWGTCPAEPG